MKRVAQIIKILLGISLFTVAPIFCARWLDLPLIPFVIVWGLFLLFIIIWSAPGKMKLPPKDDPVFPWWGF